MSNETKEYEELIKTIGMQLERAKLGKYVDLMQNPLRMITLNFVSGIARGFGIAIGFTILGAILLYFLQKLILLNLPVLSGIISQIVKMVQLNLK